MQEEMVTHSSILAWKIPWTEDPGSLQSIGSQRMDTTEYTHVIKCDEGQMGGWWIKVSDWHKEKFSQSLNSPRKNALILLLLK